MLLLPWAVQMNYFGVKSLPSESSKNNKGLAPFTALVY